MSGLKKKSLKGFLLAKRVCKFLYCSMIMQQADELTYPIVVFLERLLQKAPYPHAILEAMGSAYSLSSVQNAEIKFRYDFLPSAVLCVPLVPKWVDGVGCVSKHPINQYMPLLQHFWAKSVV